MQLQLDFPYYNLSTPTACMKLKMILNNEYVGFSSMFANAFISGEQKF